MFDEPDEDEEELDESLAELFDEDSLDFAAVLSAEPFSVEAPDLSAELDSDEDSALAFLEEEPDPLRESLR